MKQPVPNTCMQSPSNMEVFLHCHYSAAPHPRSHAPAVVDALTMLQHQGMIEARKAGTSSDDPPYRLTKRGEFYLTYVLSLPFPIEKTTYAIEAPQLD